MLFTYVEKFSNKWNKNQNDLIQIRMRLWYWFFKSLGKYMALEWIVFFFHKIYTYICYSKISVYIYYILLHRSMKYP